MHWVDAVGSRTVCHARARTLVQLDVLEPASLFACVAPEMERLAGVEA